MKYTPTKALVRTDAFSKSTVLIASKTDKKSAFIVGNEKTDVEKMRLRSQDFFRAFLLSCVHASVKPRKL